MLKNDLYLGHRFKLFKAYVRGLYDYLTYLISVKFNAFYSGFVEFFEVEVNFNLVDVSKKGFIFWDIKKNTKKYDFMRSGGDDFSRFLRAFLVKRDVYVNFDFLIYKDFVNSFAYFD